MSRNAATQTKETGKITAQDDWGNKAAPSAARLRNRMTKNMRKKLTRNLLMEIFSYPAMRALLACTLLRSTAKNRQK